MSIKRTVVAAAACFSLLAGCGLHTAAAAPTTTTTTTTPIAELTAWTPTGMTYYGPNLAWAWTDDAQVKCKDYQHGCYGITVATQYGCPNGIYIELSIVDSSGASVDRANEITAGLGKLSQAKAVLSPPGGPPKGAKAKLSQLNCLGD